MVGKVKQIRLESFNMGVFRYYVDCIINGQNVEAQIDTGSDITIIPDSIIQHGQPTDLYRVCGFPDGTQRRLSVYMSNIIIDGKSLTLMTMPGNRVLLGLDILNHCDILITSGSFEINIIESGVDDGK